MAEIVCHTEKYIDACPSTWHGFSERLKLYLGQSVRGRVKIIPVRLSMPINKMLCEMRIIEASESDKDSMLSLSKMQMEPYLNGHSLVWDRKEREKLLNESQLFKIEGNSLVGYVQLHYEGSDLYIYDLQLYPQFHGMGVGTKVIEWVKDHARIKGVTAVRLGSFKSNRACSLYEKLGFESVRQNDYFAWYKCAIT